MYFSADDAKTERDGEEVGGLLKGCGCCQRQREGSLECVEVVFVAIIG